MINQSLYNYYLPPELIAKQPAAPRDSSRLFVYDTKTNELSVAMLDPLDFQVMEFLEKKSQRRLEFVNNLQIPKQYQAEIF